MNLKLLLDTVVHLRPVQVYYQVRNRLVRKGYVPLRFEGEACVRPWAAEPVPRPVSLEDEAFTFLNLKRERPDWNFADYGPLWNYNLNYFDYLNQPGMTAGEGCGWIDRFIAALPSQRPGLDPYPTALRGINWVKFFCRHPETATPARLNALYAQYRLLQQRLEYHLLANHLLEDFFAFYVLALFLGDAEGHRRAAAGLLGELREQTLPDGAHYEQSAMYHCILLDRLLDCINMARTYGADGAEQQALQGYALRMLGHLERMTWADGSLPLFNDAACGIAPTPAELFDYARRLGLAWQALPLGACGYRKLCAGGVEVLADVGNIAATYQPGHTHADALHYELRKDGKPFVVDTGISTYDKTPRRQYERSTEAHNTVTMGGHSSSDVWGGFRVGRRARVTLVADRCDRVEAVCRTACGYTHRRSFALTADGLLRVTDTASREAVSRIHLAPEVRILSHGREGDVYLVETTLGRIAIEGAARVDIEPCRVSRVYNRLLDTQRVAITFHDTLNYTIQ